MGFLKEDLVADRYEWTDSARESTFAGTPSRRLFDRFNGQQVLFMINFFCESMGIRTPSDGRRIEDLIFTKLPLDVKSELSVLNWLRDSA